MSHTGSHRLLAALRPLVRFPAARGLREDGVFAWSTRCGPLRTVHFQFHDGTVLVQLFASMSSGRFSGLIQAIPRSRDGVESRAQTSRLNEYFINAGDACVPVGAGVLEAKFSEGVQPLVLTNDWGRELARTTVTAEPLPIKGVSPLPTFPSRSHAGDPVAFEAALFDGRLATTAIAIDSRPAPVLAVNERAAITSLDETLLGSVPFSVTGAHGRFAASIRAVRVRLDCEHTDLICGESTWISLGVDGAATDERVTLLNHAPAVVSLSGGEQAQVTIPPGEIKRLRLSGTRSGNFALSAQADFVEGNTTGAVQSRRAGMIAGRVRDVAD